MDEEERIDPAALVLSLNAQLEEANSKIEMLIKANRDWSTENLRNKAVADSLRQLIIEIVCRTKS